MIDHLKGDGGLPQMSHSRLQGRAAVEAVVEDRSGRQTTFDALFSQFISYLYNASNTSESIPSGWASLGANGFIVPEIARAGRIGSVPFTADGTLLPYSFAIYDLVQPLPPRSQVELELINSPADENLSEENTCLDDIRLHWKPLPGAIAVYAVGCKFGDYRDKLQYRLSISNRARWADQQPSAR